MEDTKRGHYVWNALENPGMYVGKECTHMKYKENAAREAHRGLVRIQWEYK